MRVLFAGTPEFAAIALKKLLTLPNIEVCAVLTQPDRPAGRGMKLMPSAVKQVASSANLPIHQPDSLKDNPEMYQILEQYDADFMVVAAYGLILPERVLTIPRHGCLNIHASLLPRWRGAAPIHRAILAGDTETGVCIMQMDVGLDTGAVLLRESLPIDVMMTTGILHDKLANIGAHLIVQALIQYAQLTPIIQPDLGITYAHKIRKVEAQIDWHQPASMIVRQIRAFNPNPGAYTTLGTKILKIWSASVLELVHNQTPGSLLSQPEVDKEIIIACGEGALRMEEVQASGGKKMSVETFLTGRNGSLF